MPLKEISIKWLLAHINPRNLAIALILAIESDWIRYDKILNLVAENQKEIAEIEILALIVFKKDFEQIYANFIWTMQFKSRAEFLLPCFTESLSNCVNLPVFWLERFDEIILQRLLQQK